MPKLTRDLFIALPGNPKPVMLLAGTDVHGRAAEVAAQIGILEKEVEIVTPVQDENPISKRKTKALKRAPERKS